MNTKEEKSCPESNQCDCDGWAESFGVSIYTSHTALSQSFLYCPYCGQLLRSRSHLNKECDHDYVGLYGHPAVYECSKCENLLKATHEDIKMRVFTRVALCGLDFKEYKKKTVTKLARVDGPFQVETREGLLSCPDGYLALDTQGWPYPIAKDEAERIYEPLSGGNMSTIGWRRQR